MIRLYLIDGGGHGTKALIARDLGVQPSTITRDFNHAERAVMAAREIVAAVQERYGDDLRVGAGINSGPVLVGTLGGGGRLEFTVIGDTVNVASRVQELTKEVGEPILLTVSTRELLGDAGDGTESRGPFNIRGKTEPIEMYSVAATVVAAAELVSD